MKILHLCLETTYNDYWGYQDNLLPKYHRKQGHDVTVITTNTKQQNGEKVATDIGEYYLDDGQRIIRLDYFRYKPNYLSRHFKIHKIYKLLCDINPDFIMVHGLGSFSALQVANYKKKVNPDCRIIADNHLDYNIGELKSGLKYKAHRFALKQLNKYVQKYYEKVYGVTPWRETYCQDVFGISPDKTGVLVMGADDEKIKFNKKDDIKTRIRNKYKIEHTDFLIVTGGKIDENKNIHLLIEAVENMKNVKLLIFGSIVSEMRIKLKKYENNSRINFVGWIDSDLVYDYFLSADLVVFPGQHSVLWEQACASKVPTVFKYWEGMDHVDLGGNCEFIYKDESEEIKRIILKIVQDKHKYFKMLKIAESDKSEKFLYSKIAEKSLEKA